MNGYPDGTFKPRKNVNRAELAVIINQLIEYIETGKVETTGETLNWKEFLDTAISMKMKYPLYWTYSKNEYSGVFAYSFSLNKKDYVFTILPSGEFDHGLPFEEPETDTDVIIGGKKAHKTVWKTSANVAVGLIKFSDLPSGWTEENRIEFAVPYNKLNEVNQVLDSIEFLPPH